MSNEPVACLLFL